MSRGKQSPCATIGRAAAASKGARHRATHKPSVSARDVAALAAVDLAGLGRPKRIASLRGALKSTAANGRAHRDSPSSSAHVGIAGSDDHYTHPNQSHKLIIEIHSRSLALPSSPKSCSIASLQASVHCALLVSPLRLPPLCHELSLPLSLSPCIHIPLH